MNPVTRIRKDHKLTRRQLCRQTRVSYAGLCNLEADLPLRMSAKTAQRLSAFSGLDPDDIQSMYAEWRNSLTDHQTN